MSDKPGTAVPSQGPATTEGSPTTTTAAATTEAPATTERTFTQADVDRIIASRVAPLQAKAAEYDKMLDSQKTDAQRQADMIARLEAENAAFRAGEIRRQAAIAAKLPPEAHALVTGTTAEEIAESVKQVQALVTSLGGPRPPAPVPGLGQVNQTPPAGDWLRQALANR